MSHHRMKMAHKKSVRPLEIKYLSSFLIKFNRILRQIIFDLAIIPIKGRCEWGNFSSVIFQTEAEIKQTVFISLFFDIGLAMLIYGSTPSFQRRRNWFFFITSVLWPNWQKCSHSEMQELNFNTYPKSSFTKVTSNYHFIVLYWLC